MYVYKVPECKSDADEDQGFHTQNGINTTCEVFDNTCHDKKNEVISHNSLNVDLPAYDCLRH